MNYKSIWNLKSKKIMPSLDKDIDTDVLIIGGGMTGVSTAYHLLNSNLKVTLVDRNVIGRGVTARTTGKITYLQENIYSKLKKYHSEAIAHKYLDSQKEAIKIISNIIKDENIDCNFTSSPSLIFVNEDKKIKLLNSERDILKKFGVSVENGDYGLKSLKVTDTYVFHPLKYLEALKLLMIDKIDIYERTKIVKIVKKKHYECLANGHIIRAKYIVLASHYPYFLKPYLFPVKCSLEKSYVSALKVDNNDSYNAITIGYPTTSIRYHRDEKNNYQIHLTSSHPLHFKSNTKDNYHNHFKQIKGKPLFTWSNKDIMTNDFLPIIGRLHKGDDTFLIGTGYNTWGMTNGSLAGKILSDIILNKKNPYEDLFAPHRPFKMIKLYKTISIIFGNMKSFVESKLIKRKKWYPSNLRILKNNKAVYTDNTGKDHVVSTLCPHLKCTLNFNEQEKTWDCPCHGSRFDIDGKCFEGPSNYDISTTK